MNKSRLIEYTQEINIVFFFFSETDFKKYKLNYYK